MVTVCKNEVWVLFEKNEKINPIWKSFKLVVTYPSLRKKNFRIEWNTSKNQIERTRDLIYLERKHPETYEWLLKIFGLCTQEIVSYVNCI